MSIIEEVVKITPPGARFDKPESKIKIKGWAKDRSGRKVLEYLFGDSEAKKG